MDVTALVKKVNQRTDEFLDTNKVLGWFDDAQRQLAMAIGANFPSFLTTDGSRSAVYEPVIPEKYHELFVIYAVARYRESESALQEMQYMDTLFDNMIKTIQRDYVPSPQYLENDYVQQFTATEGQTLFVVTKHTYSAYVPVTIYVNSTEVDFSRLDIGKLKLTTPTVANDKVTVVWENAPEMVYAPQNYIGW